MTQVKKTIQGGKRVIWSALAIAILAASVPPLKAQVQKKNFKLYPNPKFIACAGVQGGLTPTLAKPGTKRISGPMRAAISAGPSRPFSLIRSSVSIRMSILLRPKPCTWAFGSTT
jgi:hypothetical protein